MTGGLGSKPLYNRTVLAGMFGNGKAAYNQTPEWDTIKDVKILSAED